MPKKITPKSGEIVVSPTGDVVIGAPLAEAIVVLNPEPPTTPNQKD